MVRAGLGFSSAFSARAAAQRAVTQAREGPFVDEPSHALVFATAAWGPDLGDLLAAVESELGGLEFAGATVAGLFARGEASAANPGVLVALLEGANPELVLVEGLAPDDPESGPELLDHIAGSLGSRDALLLAADLHHRSPAALLSGLSRELDEALVLGLGASAPAGDDAFVWRGCERATSGVLAVALHGEAATHWGVARGYRAITDSCEVTRARDGWIGSLAGEPAVDVLRDAAARAHLEETAESLRQLLVETDREGAPLCPISGVDLRRGAILLPAPIAPGDRVRIAVRDAVAARENLERMVSEHARSGAGLGFFLSGSAHRPGLQGDMIRDARCFEQRAPDLPVLGLRAAQVLGPRGSVASACGAMPECSLLAVLGG